VQWSFFEANPTRAEALDTLIRLYWKRQAICIFGGSRKKAGFGVEVTCVKLGWVPGREAAGDIGCGVEQLRTGGRGGEWEGWWLKEVGRGRGSWVSSSGSGTFILTLLSFL
jgi:hypothetical protein